MKVDIARELSELATHDNVDSKTKETASRLAGYESLRTERADKYLPDEVHSIDDEWRQDFVTITEKGYAIARQSHVTICGMARNIGGILPVTIRRLEQITSCFLDWGLCVVENDSTDDTKQVLENLETLNPGKVVADLQDYNWPHLHGWEPERVQRYALLRNRYRELAQDHFPRTDAILCVDLDCWGGWSLDGLINGLAWMQEKKAAACMASLSLFQHELFAHGPAWGHYDTWALRVHGWRHDVNPWKTLWLPPEGSPPVQVYSAFGAAAWYRPEPFFRHAYESISGDIEHAGLHRAMISDGWDIFLNPSQRSLMTWLTEESDARRHDND
jgi:hypothetical protein